MVCLKKGKQDIWKQCISTDGARYGRADCSRGRITKQIRSHLESAGWQIGKQHSALFWLPDLPEKPVDSLSNFSQKCVIRLLTFSGTPPSVFPWTGMKFWMSIACLWDIILHMAIWWARVCTSSSQHKFHFLLSVGGHSPGECTRALFSDAVPWHAK